MRVTFLALLVLAVLAVMLGRVRRKPPDPQAAAATAMLRQKILTREFIQAAGPGHPGVPRCVLMDWNIGGAVATVVAFDDGSTSLYLSSGGGFIGAGGHENVRTAAAEFRTLAASLIREFQPTDSFPLAPGKSIIFYIVTDSATLTSGPISTSAVHRPEHPLFKLQQTAQRVITEIRRAT